MDFISKADRELSLFLNHFGAPELDALMILWSSRWVWLPLYGILLAWMFKQWQGRRFLFSVIAVAAIILLADQTASTLFKPLFARLRPCHDPQLLPLLHLPDGCGGQFGFASSHAANTMALAVFFALMPLRFRRSYVWMPLIFWSLLSGWSRIYLGFHFAGDVLAGYAIGGFWAAFMHFMLRRFRFFDGNSAENSLSVK
jgi:undecaprenyl-diphosphatase